MSSYENTYTSPNLPNASFPKFENSRNLTEFTGPLNKSIDILSKFVNSKLLSDNSLNKYYKRYIQKQAHIQHQQKIYELIEKLDDPKIFNSLKADYLKEKALLQNIHNNKKKDNKRVIYASHYINLNNCNEKLNSIYKSSSQDLNFMTSLMHYLGNRPKKIYRPKINKKLEALSQGKLALFLKKKELSKQESNTNTLYNYTNNNNYNKYKSDNLIVKSPFYKFYLKELNDKKNKSLNSFGNKNEIINKNNIRTHTNIMSKTNDNFFKFYNNNSIRRGSISNESNNKEFTQRFLGKTKSTYFGMTNYNNFINNTNYKKRKSSYYNYNNFKTENLYTNSESQNDNSNNEEKKVDNNTNNNAYNILYNRKKSKFNSQTSLFSLNNKSRSRSKNSTNNKMNSKDNMVNFTIKANHNQNKKENLIINQKYSTGISDEIDIKNILSKDSDEITYDDISLLSNVKKKDKRTIQNKLIKKYKNTMNDFLQKIKDEEKDLYNNSNKLTTLLYKFKKKGNFEKIRTQKNIKNQKRDSNATNLNQSLQKRKSTATINTKQDEGNLEKKKMAQTLYPSWGKSKFSIPYINKMIYGEENTIDAFEKLQRDLFCEVKNEIRKSNIFNKKKGNKTISINGKEILKKFKNKNKNEMDESETESQ